MVICNLEKKRGNSYSEISSSSDDDESTSSNNATKGKICLEMEIFNELIFQMFFCR